MLCFVFFKFAKSPTVCKVSSILENATDFYFRPKATEQIYPHKEAAKYLNGGWGCFESSQYRLDYQEGGGGGCGCSRCGEYMESLPRDVLRLRNGWTSVLYYIKKKKINKSSSSNSKPPAEISESGFGNYSQHLLSPPSPFLSCIILMWRNQMRSYPVNGSRLNFQYESCFLFLKSCVVIWPISAPIWSHQLRRVWGCCFFVFF